MKNPLNDLLQPPGTNLVDIILLAGVLIQGELVWTVDVSSLTRYKDEENRQNELQ